MASSSTTESGPMPFLDQQNEGARVAFKVLAKTTKHEPYRHSCVYSPSLLLVRLLRMAAHHVHKRPSPPSPPVFDFSVLPNPPSQRCLSGGFTTRMATLPLANNVLGAYEQMKANSKIAKVWFFPVSLSHPSFHARESYVDA